MTILEHLSHTILSPRVIEHYAADPSIGEITGCRLLQHGINDTYRLDTTTGPYVVRLYRKGWRSHSEICYELDALQFLQHHQVDVSYPLRRFDGSLKVIVPTFEGERTLVIMTWAPGSVPPLDEVHARGMGRLLANVHAMGDMFASGFERFQLNQDTLVLQPCERLLPMLQNPDHRRRLQQFRDTTIHFLDEANLEIGFCHGDLHDWNVHVNNGQLTAFDFDCAGRGFRAYDLAVFDWILQTQYPALRERGWSSFLKGYQEVRPLHSFDRQVIPRFVAVRRLWILDLYLRVPDVFGGGWWNENTEARFMSMLDVEVSS